MGRKGKKHRKFVDKNDPNTYTFALIHRSQHDPRIADSEASPFVLHPVESQNAARRKRRGDRGADASAQGREPDLPDMGIPILREEDEERHGRPRLQPRSTPSHHTQELHYDDDDDLDDLGDGMGDNPEVYGIYYDDDYDYMQHLREPGAPGADTYFVDEQSRFEFLARQGVAKHANLDLPEELLPSVGEEEIGLLNRAAPRSGPQLDLDPDVVAALEEEEKAVEDNADDAADYEDYLNLVLRGDGGNDDYYGEYEDDDEGERTPRASDNEADSDDGHFAVSDDDDVDDNDDGHQQGGDARPRGTTTSEDAAYDDIWREIAHGTRRNASAAQAKTEVKSRFTEYSMTSSVVPRSEALQHIDQGFEIFYEKYDDENIGGLDEIADEAEMTISESDIRALEDETEAFCDEMRKRGLMKDKQLSYAQERRRMREEDLRERRAKAASHTGKGANAETTTTADAAAQKKGEKEQEEGRATPTASAPEGDHSVGDDASDSGDESSEHETVVMVVPGKAKERREWDCESVLSLRSTLYNHPTVIDERGRSRKRGQRHKQQQRQEQQQRPEHIQIDPKTGIPVEGLALIGRGREESDDSDSDSDVPAVNEGQPRPKKESKEEKKARKKAIKEQRQARRAQKKQTKQAFKEEIKRQQKMHDV